MGSKARFMVTLMGLAAGGGAGYLIYRWVGCAGGG